MAKRNPFPPRGGRTGYTVVIYDGPHMADEIFAKYPAIGDLEKMWAKRSTITEVAETKLRDKGKTGKFRVELLDGKNVIKNWTVTIAPQQARVKKRGGLWIVEISGPRGWIVGGEWKTKREAEADAKIYRSNPVARKKRRTAKQIAATKKLVAFNKKRRGKKKATRRNPRRRKVVRKKATRRRVAKKKIATRKRRGTAKTRTRDYVIFKCNGSAVHYLSLSTSGKKSWTASRERALHWTGKKVAAGIAKKTRSATGVAASSSSKSEIASFCRGK